MNLTEKQYPRPRRIRSAHRAANDRKGTVRLSGTSASSPIPLDDLRGRGVDCGDRSALRAHAAASVQS